MQNRLKVSDSPKVHVKADQSLFCEEAVMRHTEAAEIINAMFSQSPYEEGIATEKGQVER